MGTPWTGSLWRKEKSCPWTQNVQLARLTASLLPGLGGLYDAIRRSHGLQLPEIRGLVLGEVGGTDTAGVRSGGALRRLMVFLLHRAGTRLREQELANWWQQPGGEQEVNVLLEFWISDRLEKKDEKNGRIHTLAIEARESALNRAQSDACEQLADLLSGHLL